MSKKLLFSILTPTKNRAGSFLAQTIRSVQTQVCNDFNYEHILINDGSTDNTDKVIKQFQKSDSRIKYIGLKESVGPAKALNRGFKMSKGELITTLDDDDILPPTSLALRVEFMRLNPKVDWSSGFLINIDKDNRLYFDLLEQTTPFDIAKGNFFQKMLKTNWIKNNTLAIRRKALEKIQGWDENIHAGQDWALYMDLIHHKFKYALNHSYLALYRIHKKQRSGKFAKDKSWEKTREYFIQKYNL
jgi:glycosyltransferase involved in cell wall biosynthesis